MRTRVKTNGVLPHPALAGVEVFAKVVDACEAAETESLSVFGLYVVTPSVYTAARERPGDAWVLLRPGKR